MKLEIAATDCMGEGKNGYDGRFFLLGTLSCLQLASSL